MIVMHLSEFMVDLVIEDRTWLEALKLIRALVRLRTNCRI